MKKNPLSLVAVLLALAVAQTANAAIDVSAATTGISDASTASVAVLGAMIGVAAVAYGLKRVKRLLGG